MDNEQRLFLSVSVCIHCQRSEITSDRSENSVDVDVDVDITDDRPIAPNSIKHQTFRMPLM